MEGRRLFLFFLSSLGSVAIVGPASSVVEVVHALAPRTWDVGMELLLLMQFQESSSSKSVCVAVVLLVRVWSAVTGVSGTGVVGAGSTVSVINTLGECTSLGGSLVTVVAQASQVWQLVCMSTLTSAAQMTMLSFVMYGTLLKSSHIMQDFLSGEMR